MDIDMTVTTTTRDVSYNGNGAITVFAIPFEFFEISVILVDATSNSQTWSENVHYTVTGGNGSSGTLTVKTSPTDYTPQTGETLIIKRITEKTQTTKYVENDDFPAASHEGALDRLTMIAQETADDALVSQAGGYLLGANATDPIVDLYGVALNKNGYVHFNTTSNKWRGYVGGTWSDLFPSDAVSSFAGRTGSVVPQAADYASYYTTSTDQASTAAGKGASLIGIQDAAGNLDAVDVEAAIAEIYSDFRRSTDLASTAAGKGASLIGIEDAAGNFASTNLEGALAEIKQATLVALIEDQKSSGTHGGTFTSGADRTRDLNTLVYNKDSTVSLSANRFTLPAGTWLIKWRAPAYACRYHQTHLYDYTGSAEIKRGNSIYTNASYQGHDFSEGVAVVTLTSSKEFEIRHRCSSSSSTYGFGLAPGYGIEVYTQVEIHKL